MQSSTLLTALMMGLVGGPHCLVMCGSACAAVGRTNQRNATENILGFQTGRLLGYATLGAAAAASMQGFGWLTTHSSLLRPVWSLFHVAVMLLGLLLLIQARQPVWLEQGARRVWRRVMAWTGGSNNAAPVLLGVCWALMPCGLLYSAVLVAALSGGVLEGALTMGAFAVGSGLYLLIGPWLLLRVRVLQTGDWGVRVAGLLLLASSGWALWMALTQDAAPWCVTT